MKNTNNPDVVKPLIQEVQVSVSAQERHLEMSDYTDTVQRITQDWGWSQPQPQLMDLALLSIKLQHLNTKDAVIHLGLLDDITVTELLANKPENTHSLKWLSINLPRISDGLDKIMTLRAGLQYFEDFLLFGITLHPDMKIDALRRYCVSKHCVLVLIEEITPVLCFGKYDDLMRYRMMTQSERIQLLAIQNDPILSVANTQQVTEWIASAGSITTKHVELEQKNLWLTKDTQENKALQRFSSLIDAAIAKASDIDIHPLRSGQGQVMFRISTLMFDPPGGKFFLSAEELSEIIRYLAKKSGANPTGARIREPRDGQLIYRSASGEVFIRVSFIPLDPGGSSYDTISVDLRLHRRQERQISLDNLNMQADVVATCEEAASYSQGLILFIGPTNTGKSTSLAGLIGAHQKIHGDARKRISIEQPVELFLPAVKQISLPSEHLFAEYFRAILRHDPDMIIIGEIRDEQTANTAVDASLSGHLVASSLHANNTLIGLRRLINMVPEYKRIDLIETTELLVSQRLVKRLCKSCYEGESREPTDVEIEKIQKYGDSKGIEITIPARLPVRTRTTCIYCNDSGFKGVLPIHETLPVTRAVKDMLLSGNYTYQAVGKHRTRTLHKSAMELVEACETELDVFFI